MKQQWEEHAKDHFIADLKAQGRGEWVVSSEDIVVDKQSGINFDYQLQRGTDFIALEIFRLVETRDEIIRQRSWSTIANSIASELRKRGIKGYTIHSPYFFDVSRLKIPAFVSRTADRIEAALKQNPPTDLITVDGFEINKIEDFQDVSLFATGPGGAVNPTGSALHFITAKLPRKNQQLDIANHERIVLIVNWVVMVDLSNMVEACSLIDFSQFENIDKVYFEIPHNNQIHLVYDRAVYAAFRPDGKAPERLEPLFMSWLGNLLFRKDMQAFLLVRNITDREKSLLWLPAISREQLVVFGEDFLSKAKAEELYWVVENLKDDPDPSIDNSENDPEGRFNDHLRTKRGESTRIIHSVRGRLCWLMMQIVTQPRIEDYDRVFELVERVATQENLYLRQQVTVPLVELARRRFARVDGNTPFMSGELANRIRTLALRMIDENMAYPVVLESVAHVMVFVQDLDQDTALKTIGQFLTIDHSEAANDISSMMIYFAFYRENQFQERGTFESKNIRHLLKETLTNGSRQLRATAAAHFKTILDLNEVAFDSLIPYLEALVSGQTNHVVNHHLYEILAKQATADPETVGRLIEQAVSGELKSLGSGGRNVWHPRALAEALHAIEQIGSPHKERVAEIRQSLKPYREQGRIFDLHDFS